MEGYYVLSTVFYNYTNYCTAWSSWLYALRRDTYWYSITTLALSPGSPSRPVEIGGVTVFLCEFKGLGTRLQLHCTLYYSSDLPVSSYVPADGVCDVRWKVRGVQQDQVGDHHPETQSVVLLYCSPRLHHYMPIYTVHCTLYW